LDRRWDVAATIYPGTDLALHSSRSEGRKMYRAAGAQFNRHRRAISLHSIFPPLPSPTQARRGMKQSLLPPMFRRLAPHLVLLSMLAVLARTAAQGQLAAPPGTNLFGDEIVRKIETPPGKRFGDVPPPSDDEAKAVQAKAVGYTQVLIFQNERQLRGEIVSLSKDEVVWRRPDASAPIRFPRSTIRRLIFARNQDVPAIDPPPGAPEVELPPGPIKATVALWRSRERRWPDVHAKDQYQDQLHSSPGGDRMVVLR
jgi:hypothetical protein